MQNTAVLYRKSLVGRRPTNEAAAPTPKLVRDYLLVSEIPQRETAWIKSLETRQFSEDTLDLRKTCLTILKDFLKYHGYTTCGETEMHAFFHHLAVDGRRPSTSGKSTKLQPNTIKTYFTVLTVFFKYCVEVGILTASPMEKLDIPKWKRPNIRPFTPEQIRDLLQISKLGFYPKRDRAIILLLLDTGIRAAELCGLTWGVVDLQARRCTVLGKGRLGGKERQVYFSTTTYRAIMDYRRDETAVDCQRAGEIDLKSPLFYSDRGTRTGSGITESGLLQLIKRLGDRAGLQGVRCSPHTFRHTFALNFIRAGGDVFALKEALGHEDIKMVQTYLHLAKSDIEIQSRKHSPVEFMLKKKP